MAHKLTKVLFIALSVAFLALLAVMLQGRPYSAEVSQSDRILHIVGKQFPLTLSESPISTDKEREEGIYSARVEVPAGPPSSLVLHLN